MKALRVCQMLNFNNMTEWKNVTRFQGKEFKLTDTHTEDPPPPQMTLTHTWKLFLSPGTTAPCPYKVKYSHNLWLRRCSDRKDPRRNLQRAGRPPCFTLFVCDVAEASWHTHRPPCGRRSGGRGQQTGRCRNEACTHRAAERACVCADSSNASVTRRSSALRDICTKTIQNCKCAKFQEPVFDVRACVSFSVCPAHIPTMS